MHYIVTSAFQSYDHLFLEWHCKVIEGWYSQFERKTGKIFGLVMVILNATGLKVCMMTISKVSFFIIII